MKPVNAWAVVRPNGKMVLWDGQYPIFWYRKPAQTFTDRLPFAHNFRVMRVEIRELKAKKGGRK